MRCSQPQINIQEIRVVFQDVTEIFYGSIGRYAVIIIIIFVHLSANNSTNIVKIVALGYQRSHQRQ